MGGPGSGRRRKPPTAQPRGTRWLSARAACFAQHGDTCHICQHPGATEADHLVPTDDPREYLNVDNLRPAHGGRRPCPTCGKACNQSRGGARRIAAQARRNGHAQNGAGKTRDAAKTVALRAQIAEQGHHQACACRGRSAPKDAVFHHQACLCAALGPQLGSRCW